VDRHLRIAAVWIAISAMILRGIVPVGWMPNTAAGAHHAAFMPCPMMMGGMPMDGMRMDGMRHMPQPSHPAKQDPASPHDGGVCPYAATAHYTPTTTPPAVLPADIVVGHADLDARLLVKPSHPRNWDHAPRAPPLST